MPDILYRSDATYWFLACSISLLLILIRTLRGKYDCLHFAEAQRGYINCQNYLASNEPEEPRGSWILYPFFFHCSYSFSKKRNSQHFGTVLWDAMYYTRLKKTNNIWITRDKPDTNNTLRKKYCYLPENGVSRYCLTQSLKNLEPKFYIK